MNKDMPVTIVQKLTNPVERIVRRPDLWYKTWGKCRVASSGGSSITRNRRATRERLECDLDEWRQQHDEHVP